MVPGARASTAVCTDANLNILRSVAVLAVFVCHFLQVLAGCKYGEYSAFGVDTYALGRLGVLIFFVHTSFVLMQSLERTRLSGFPLMRHFYIRRIFRIYPLSTCLILASVVLFIPANALGVTYEWQGFGWLWANLLLVQDIAGVPHVSGPLWSLQYELAMYLILPVLFLILKNLNIKNSLVTIYLTGSILMFSPIRRFAPCFLAGVVAYKLAGTVRPHIPAWLWCPALLGVVASYCLSPLSGLSAMKDNLSCLMVGALIPVFQRNRGVIAGAAAQIAKYSYGIYLCHTPVLWLLYRKLTLPGWGSAILLLPATAALSAACFHFIEHPMIQLGTRLANRASSKRELQVVAAIS